MEHAPAGLAPGVNGRLPYMELVDRRPVFPSVHGVSGPETGCMPYPSHGVLGTASLIAFHGIFGSCVLRPPPKGLFFGSAVERQFWAHFDHAT